MVSEEIHHLEEVRHIVTVVGQRNQGTLPKWESAKDRAVTWSDLKHMEPKILSFLIKQSTMSYQHKSTFTLGG